MTGAMSALPRSVACRSHPLDGRGRCARAVHAWSASPFVPRMTEPVVFAVATVLLLSGPARLLGAAAVLGRAMRSPAPRLTVRPGAGLARGCVELLALYGGAAALGGVVVVEQAGSWVVVAVVGLGSSVLVDLSRVLCRRFSTAGRLRVAVVSTDRRRAPVAAMMRQHRRYGLDPVTIRLSVGDDGEAVVSELAAALDRSGADVVVVVEDGMPRAVLHDVVLAVGERRPLFIAPARASALAFGVTVETLWSERIAAAPVPVMQRPAWIVGAAVQRALAAVALVLLAPLLGVLALGVRLTSPGPVLFRQTRVGLRGEEFTVVKFRSMPVDHDAAAGWNAASRAEPTRLGRIMRDLSLDELPQLVNVVRGEMCLVGPRPELPRYVSIFEDHVEGYRDRHRVPVGLTGWAQVHGLRGDTSIADRARFDNNYIDDWSIARDIAVLFGTVAQLLPPPFRPSPPMEDETPIDLVDERRGRARPEARLETKAAQVS